MVPLFGAHPVYFSVGNGQPGNQHCANCIGTLSFPIGNIRCEPKLFGRWQQRRGRLLSVTIATFSLSQSGTGVWCGAPSRRASGGITPENFWNSICDLVHFDAIWWQLYVGLRTRYICNFAIKIEPICQLQCPHDCTAVLSIIIIINFT